MVASSHPNPAISRVRVRGLIAGLTGRGLLPESPILFRMGEAPIEGIEPSTNAYMGAYAFVLPAKLYRLNGPTTRI